MCGDSRDDADMSRLFGDAVAQMAFTSPPYASQRKYDESSGFTPIKPDDYCEWFEGVAANVKAHLADNGSWFVNIKAHCEDGQRSLYVHDLVTTHVREWGWKFIDELVWERGGFPGDFPNRFKNAWEPVFHFTQSQGIVFNPLANGVPSDAVFKYEKNSALSLQSDGYHDRDLPSEFTQGLARPCNLIKTQPGGDGSHTAAFPVKLPAWFIRAYSNKRDTVFDPFMGSGSTLIAADNEDRVALGMELSPAYCDVICQRFEQHTGVAPMLDS
jgi:site-specific DNA-methyltransferase (adenine-specific)/site-specific DNA-methyltransferase (cytosine-N4-specific)